MNFLYSQDFKEFPHIKQLTISDKINDSIRVRNIQFFKYRDNQLIEKIEVNSTKQETTKYLYYYDSNKYLIKTEYLINDTLIYYTKQYKLNKKEIIEFYFRKSPKQIDKFVLKNKEIKEHKSDTYIIEKEKYKGDRSLHYILLGFNHRVWHKYYDNDFLYFYKVDASWGGDWGYSSTYIIKVDKNREISYSLDKKNNFMEKHINYFDEYGNIIKSELYIDLNDVKPTITTFEIVYE